MAHAALDKRATLTNLGLKFGVVMHKYLASLCFALFACVSVAHAQSNLDRTLHLALEGSLFEDRSLTFEPKGADESDLVEYDVKQSRFGLPRGAAARVGYMPSNNLEFGGVLEFDRETREVEEVETSEYELNLNAYFRYVVTGGRARFFVGPTLGLSFIGGSGSDDEDDIEQESSGRLFLIGAEVGLYAFVTSGLSIDPMLSLRYATGSIEEEFDGVDYDQNISWFQISLGFALSGWVGLR